MASNPTPLPTGGTAALTLTEQNDILTDMTPDQIQRGLFPRTLDDLRFRASAFSRIDPDKLSNPPNPQKKGK